MNKKLPKLSIAVPCFNEQEVLPKTIQKLSSLLDELIFQKKIEEDSFVLFVDDCSTDATSKILSAAHFSSPNRIKYVKFTKNFGNQSAIYAGVKESYLRFEADCVVTIDADLQQDETKIADFIDKMNEGYDIVAGIKITRGKEPFYKKIAGTMFYKIMNFLGAKIQANHSEYRLLTKNAIKQLLEYPEKTLFLRGLLAELGLKTAKVDYTVKDREAGVSKFTFIKLLNLAFQGIVSHTARPLHIIFIAGLVVTLVCFVVLAAAVILEFTTPNGLPNVHFFEVWNTFLSGIQILCLGIIGQYIGQILIEVKQRPIYLLDENLQDKND